MNEYINKSDALDILDQLEDAIENGERGFYSQARKMMCDLHSEEIIHCKDCKLYKTKYCAIDTWTDGAKFYRVGPDDFCSMAIEKK